MFDWMALFKNYEYSTLVNNYTDLQYVDHAIEDMSIEIKVRLKKEVK